MASPDQSKRSSHQSFDSNENIQKIIIKNIKQVAKDFVPKNGESSSQRVKHLLGVATDNIVSSGALDNITESQKETLYAFLESSELLTNTYQMALNARVKHFKAVMNNHFRELGSENGLAWVTYRS